MALVCRCWLTWYIGRGRWKAKKIVAVPLQNDIATMDVGLLWPAGRPLSGSARLFRDFLIQACDGV